MNRFEIAMDYFYSGSGCAQSVVLAFMDKIELSENHIKKAASSFGSGMGKLQFTCGALTGAYMVIGFISPIANNRSEKEYQYSQIQELTEKFKMEHKNTTCDKLLNCNFNTEKGEKHFQDNNLKKNVCSHCIKTSILLLEEYI